MRLEQFQYIVEISRYKSMSKAAKKLFITQPSLSTSIQNLEEELGLQLFKRSSHGVSLTAQGEKIVSIAENIVQQIEQIKAISNQAETISGDINLVAAPVACNSLIFHLMFKVRKDYPNVNLNITELRPSKTIQAIAQGPATIGIGTYSENQKNQVLAEARRHALTIEELFVDEMYVYLHRNHPLLQKKAISLQELAPYTQVFFKDHALMTTFDRPTLKDAHSTDCLHFSDGDMLKKAVPESGIYGIHKNIPASSHLCFSDRESIKKAVAEGIAYAILPKLMSIEDIYVTSGLISAIPLIDCDTTLTTYLVYSAKTLPTLTEQKTLDTIKQIYQEVQKKYPANTLIPPDSHPPSKLYY